MRDAYFVNAEKLAREGEFTKASEFLWGAVTQAIKALAAKFDIRIDKHSQFFGFMETLAKEVKEPQLYEDFLFLNDLHKNFYDEKIRPADYEIYLKKAVLFIRKLEKLMEKER
ncbi:MAG: PaREP1 family protein [Candidatus Bathyarchaeia archaeon]